MEHMDYWRLCEELNIVQAALLVIGEDASLSKYAEGWDLEKRPAGYEATKTAICSGLRNYIRYKKELEEFEEQDANRQFDHPDIPTVLEENDEYLSSLFRRSITGTLVEEQEYDINGHPNGNIEDTVDVYRSLVSADSLKQWLRLKGVASGFFFPEPVEILDFLDSSNPRYAPKLAASVRAWQSVTDAGKRSPKQALDKWLREHAADYNLTNDEGKPIEQAIEECSKVANWNPKGGATKTPT